jgi:iron complex transport system ATP-binding protein
MRELSMQLTQLVVGHNKKGINQPFSFDFFKGEIVAVVGRNGSGKSTLLKSICGLYPIVSGNVSIGQKNLSEISLSARAQHIAVVLTNRPQLTGISVFELIEMGVHSTSKATTKEEKESQVMEILQLLQLENLMSKPLAQLSDGELQRAYIARAIAQKTAVIIMDEPTAFLDFVSKEEIFLLLKKIVDQKKITIVLSSHDLEMVAKYCDRQIWIEKGEFKEKKNA